MGLGYHLWLVDWRAARIRDPVARLRYLRAAAAPKAPLRTRWARQIHAVERALLLLAVVVLVPTATVSDVEPPLQLPFPQVAGSAAPPERFEKVWPVELKPGYEVFSNGLRIETRSTLRPDGSQPGFQALRRGDLSPVDLSGSMFIVFHTTESHQAPFEEEFNRRLRVIGDELLVYVGRHRAYHYVIDRFGRVHRVVPESEPADHAGFSVWMDSSHVYLNLNQSFLGVAFEAQTAVDGGRPSVNPAQVHSARVLTQMLRARYGIPARNCVTHAQISVNPGNMRIGYHTDWAANFPFEELGLGDNYAVPLPSLYVFGFGYDDTLVSQSGARLWKGLLLSEEQFRQDAAAQGLPARTYKRILRKRYRSLLEALQARSAAREEKENGSE